MLDRVAGADEAASLFAHVVADHAEALLGGADGPEELGFLLVAVLPPLGEVGGNP